MTYTGTTRMRHEKARRRQLTVREKRQLTPNYLSILFACDDFEDFVSASADDHIKLFLKGERSAGGKPPMRDYTPRAFDADKGEFTIDFALHADPGPATRWAMEAAVGDTIQIGGPRGSVVMPKDCDWYWLIGDEAAIPSMARFMEEHQSSKVAAFIAVAGVEEQVPLQISPTQSVQFVHRQASEEADPAALLNAIADLSLPEGDGFVWIAAEAVVARSLREAVLAKGLPLQRLKAKGYWVAGKADSTERFD